MKILMATDGSRHSRAALEFLIAMPLPPEIDVRVVTVIEDLGLPSLVSSRPGALAELQKTIRSRTAKQLNRDLRRLSDMPWQVRSEIREGHPADELLEAIHAHQPTLTVVGSRGLNAFQGYLLGQVSYRVATNSPSSVLIAKPVLPPDEEDDGSLEAPRIRRILLALDNSTGSWQALKSLASLPLPKETEVEILTIMTVVTHYRMDILQRLSVFWQKEKDAALERLQEAAEVLGPAVRVQTLLKESADVAHEILRHARDSNPDLLVLGHKGMSSIERFLLGSVSSKIIHHAPCSVLLVKGTGLAP